MCAKLTLGARLILGLIFLIFGINGLMFFTMGKGFIPMPPPSAEMMTIMTGFMATKYMMVLVKILEVVAGIFLVAGIYLNLSLVLLGPIMVNILGIHLFVDLSGAPMAIFLTVLYVMVLKSRCEYFKPLLNK